ncbi:prephenate dehydrogenase [Pseudoalteromonas sp. YIC-656]|uniref:prephenate dehydrogenase n=1 Tax=Pseudoalteromonas pernae TaxID=3118054 RepID=UPI0032428D55
MNSIIEKLNDNLKLAYRQALDADQKLDQLQKDGHGKFQALFNEDAGFSFEAKRFKPYVLDVAADVDTLSQNDELDPELLKTTVLKLQNLLALLATFKTN